jgi:DNA-nicking Smr family endonuclease
MPATCCSYGAMLSPRASCCNGFAVAKSPCRTNWTCHGADTREAEALLRAFLAHAREHDAGCVRIIHGKGLHGSAVPVSPPRMPVLKNWWTACCASARTSCGFHSAPPAQGGTGAVLVIAAPRRSGSA